MNAVASDIDIDVDIDEQNETLVRRLLAGDTDARDCLIEINRRLVFTTVRRFLHNWSDLKHLHADLIGVGMIALVQAVDRLAKIGEANRPIRNYLITAIRSKLHTELINEVEHYRSHWYVDTYSKIPEHALAENDPSFNQIENREFLLSLCESAREQEILTCFLEGQKPVDIIKTTGYTPKVVHKTFQQLREKLRVSRENMSGAEIV